jgi:OmcA/MtrC family decaheme c-type cytochrome
MLTLQTKKNMVVVLGLAAVAAAAAQSVGFRSIKEMLNPRQKAYYMDATTAEFVRPGLNISIQSAAIASDGTITTNFTLADPGGLPLDIAGVTTPGTISLSYLAASIPIGQEQYVSYITRVATGAVIATVNQPAADSGGTLTPVGPGQYTYTFKTKATGFDPTTTNTIGIYGSRNLTTYSLNTDYASTTFNFVPNGSNVVTTRDVIRDASCDRCHDQLSFHGGSRRGIAICVMCHQPQNADPASGNSLDLKVMAHKIHMGSSLPSVLAGKPYQIVGFQNAISDFSTIVDPAMAQRCTVCHDQTTKAAQATTYLTQPTRVACGSCHDDVNFATGANHPGGAYTDDSKCSTCHIPQGAQDFDDSIAGAHVVPADSSLLTGLNAAIASVTNGTAGSKPVVTFKLTDSSGNGVAPKLLGSLSLTMSGPTADYGLTNFGSDVTTPGYVTESALTASSCAPDGTCTYSFTHAVPAGATGTFVMGLEARRTDNILAGTPKAQSVTYGASNPVSYFSVDGSTVAPRRLVVALTNCQQCHVKFTTIHGGLRNNTLYCVECHNPSNSDASLRPTATVAADKALPPQGINFNLLVHNIHRGPNNLAGGAQYPYVVVGFGGSHNDFSGVLYPPFGATGNVGDTRNCSMCHVGGSEQNLPIGLNAVTNPQGWINPAPATTAACSGCHVSKAEASHMLSATTSLGEACSVCHSPGTDFSVAQEHAQY